MRRAAPSLAVLALLAAAVPAHAYTVAPGDTLSGIAAARGVAVGELAAANDIDDRDMIRAGDRLTIPGGRAAGGPATHAVEPGESLFALADRYGLSVAALADANGIADRGHIEVGQVLKVPGGASRGVGAAAQDAADGAAAARTGRAASKERARALIVDAARSHGWDPAVPLGLAMQESGWNNTVVSPDGARGIMQVLPATADWVNMFLSDRELDLDDPADNVAAGMAYLDHLYGRYDGDVELALAAYYGGPGKVTGERVPAWGRRYVANVLALAERYR